MRLSEHRQVMAGLGADFEGHFAAVPGHQPVEEMPGSAGEALLVLLARRGVRVGLFAPLAQADLPHHPLEELGHVVLQSRRRLNELAVKDSSAGLALCKGRAGSWHGPAGNPKCCGTGTATCTTADARPGTRGEMWGKQLGMSPLRRSPPDRTFTPYSPSSDTSRHRTRSVLFPTRMMGMSSAWRARRSWMRSSEALSKLSRSVTE